MRIFCNSKELAPNIDLYYFNARWYDPKTGRFTTEDPIRDGINWFVYASNNPLRFVDPTGLINVIADDVNSEAITQYDDYVADLETRIDQKNGDLNQVDSIAEAESISEDIQTLEGSLPIDWSNFEQTDVAYDQLANYYSEEGLDNPGRYACAYLSSMYNVFTKDNHTATRADLMSIANDASKTGGSYGRTVLGNDYVVGDFSKLLDMGMSHVNGDYQAKWMPSSDDSDFSLNWGTTTNLNEHWTSMSSSGSTVFDANPSILTSTPSGSINYKWVLND